MKSIEGVSDISRQERTGARPVTWTGLKSPSTLNYYYYDFQGISGWLYFEEDYKKRVEFNQGYITVNKPAPQTEIDTLLPAMLQIERRLEVECGLPNLVANIEESCLGAKCTK